MARREPPWHERTTALDNSMEPADRTEIAPTGPSEVAEPLCAAPARGDVRWAPLQEIAESVIRATTYLTDQLSWCCPMMEERLVTLHNDIDEAFETYALCTGRNASKHTELRNHLAWLLGDNLLEGAFDYDSDDYQDDYEDTWDDETTWGKGSTTTPTTVTSGVQLVTTPPQLVTTPPHVFRLGSPAPPEAIHVDAGNKSAMTLNYPADKCADSTADDRALAERRARGSGAQLTTTPPQLTTTDVNTLPVALAKRFQVETSALRWVRADAAKLRKAAVLPGHEMSIAEGEEQHAFESEFDKLQGGLLLPARLVGEDEVDACRLGFALNHETFVRLFDRDSTVLKVAHDALKDDGVIGAKNWKQHRFDAMTNKVDNKINRTTQRGLKQKFKLVAGMLRSMKLGAESVFPIALANYKASQMANDATSAAPVSISPETNDAPPVPKGASTSALRAGPDAQRRPPGPNGRRRTATPVRRRPLGTRLFERPSPLGSNALPVPVLPPGSHPAPLPPPEPPPTHHSADRHAPPTPAPPPGSHPAPLPPPEPPPVHRPTCRHAPPAPVPPPGSHPAPLPPPEPPPVQHPAPLPPPQPPPELEVGESDDENWTPPPPGSHPAPLPPPEPPPVQHPAPLPPPQPPPESKGGEFDDENWTLWAPYYLPAPTTMASATTATAVQRARDDPLTLPDDTAPATVVPAMLP